MSGTVFPTRNGYSVPRDRNLSRSVKVMQQWVTGGSLGHVQERKDKKKKKGVNLKQRIASNREWSNPLFCCVYVIYASLCSQLSQRGVCICWLFFLFFKISYAHLEQIFASLDWEILPAVPMLRCWFSVMAGWFGSFYSLPTGSRWDCEIKSDEASFFEEIHHSMEPYIQI